MSCKICANLRNDDTCLKGTAFPQGNCKEFTPTKDACKKIFSIMNSKPEKEIDNITNIIKASLDGKLKEGEDLDEVASKIPTEYVNSIFSLPKKNKKKKNPFVYHAVIEE